MKFTKLSKYKNTKRVTFGLLIAAALSMNASADLVAHFPLDNLSGTVVPNTTGGPNGTLVNPSDVATGVSAVHGDGITLSSTATTSGAINLGDNAGVKMSDDFTISMWFNGNSFSVFDRLIESMDGTAATSNGLRIDTGGTGTKVRALLRNGTGSQVAFEHSQVLSTNTWYFAAVRFDADSNTQITVLPQGSPATGASIGGGTESTASTVGPLTYQAGRPTMVGVQDSGANQVNAFIGSLDDIAFYDSILTDADLANVYNNGAIVIPTGAVPPPSATQGWDAKTGPASGNWDSTVGTTHHFNLIANAAAAPDQTVYGRGGDRTYSYSGDENVLLRNTANAARAFADFGATGDSASFEMIFKPNGLNNGKQVLWETGGINGSSLTLTDNVLRFGTATQLNTPDEIGLTHTLTSDSEFVHVLGVVDHANNETRMYVDGVLVDTFAGVNGTWSGGNAAGLGSIQAAATGGFNDAGTAGVSTDEGGTPGYFGTFVGEVSQFNFYPGVFNNGQAAELAANANVISGDVLPIVGSVTLNYDAAEAGGSPTQWQPNLSTQGSNVMNYILEGTSAPTLTTDFTTIHDIEAAFRFDGDGKARAGVAYTSFIGNAADESMTLEIWAQPTDLLGKEVLWEDGGSGSGSSIRLDDDELIFRVKNGSINIEAMATLTAGDIADFIQVAVSIDVENDMIHLYLNGVLVSSTAAGADLVAWGGGEGGALGNLHAAQIGGTTAATGGDLEVAGFGGFVGDIAISRFYRNQVLDGDQVLQNYDAIAGIPEPTSLIVMAGLIGMIGVRRQR